jgi:phosphohistidine phosphatase
MKRLVVVRHAKAEQGGYDHDFSRSLTERGSDDAYRIANELVEREIRPDRIIASPAKRALTTARIFAEELGFDKTRIQEKKQLYFDLSNNQFIEMIQNVSDEASTVFVFGHNPFMYYIANHLCNDFMGDMPTCSTVVIDFAIDSWNQLKAHQGKLNVHLYPSALK